MPRLLKAFFRPLFSKVQYESWEWTIMRLAFAWFGIYQGTALTSDYYAQPDPAGIAQFVNITWITSSIGQPILTFLFWVLLVLYCVNRLPLLATAGLLVIHTLYGTLENSQGATHHHAQIVGFILLGQVLAYLYWKIRLRYDRSLSRPTPGSSLIYLSQQLIAAGYVASAFSKLMRSQGNWISDTVHFPVQLAKGSDKQFYNFLVEAPAASGEWLIRFVTENPFMAKVFLGTGLFLELFAVLALLNRSFLAVYGLALFVMHSTISELMGLGFALNKVVLLIFFVNLPWWLLQVYKVTHKNRAVRD